MTGPQVVVSQVINADTYEVSLDVTAVVVEHLPLILAALSGHRWEISVLMDSANGSARRRDAAADLKAALVDRLPTPVTVDLDPSAARGLAEDLRDAAHPPEHCPGWAQCGRYAAGCDVHGSLEYVAEPAERAS